MTQTLRWHLIRETESECQKGRDGCCRNPGLRLEEPGIRFLVGLRLWLSLSFGTFQNRLKCLYSLREVFKRCNVKLFLTADKDRPTEGADWICGLCGMYYDFEQSETQQSQFFPGRGLVDPASFQRTVVWGYRPELSPEHLHLQSQPRRVLQGL